MSYTELLTEWLSNPTPIIVTFVGSVVAGSLYWRGARYARRTGIGQPVRALQAIAFASGLFTVFIAIASPVDTLADHFFAVHMIQHELLILVAAPLLLLGDPFWRMWRALPTAWRRTSLRWLMRRQRAREVWKGIEAFISRSVAVLLLFLGVFFAWHIPALYQFALRHEVVHAVEHVSFLVVALLFWARVIPAFPLRSTMSYIRRAGYLFIVSIAMHLCAILISIANRPIYTYYGVDSNAVANQTAGGAIMDVSGMVVFTLAILVFLGLWLRDDAIARDAEMGVAREESAVASASGSLLLMEVGMAEPVVEHPAHEG